ncbi:PREDICTED: acetylajmalan esterase-like [Ipomoea nil]|uniref:acetylajmalan esterase-like n=1 Tax=Ipomoea nil TaxID=35883 RepID=UPI000900E39E|nr:PREDICTED: acetylajmalan esterase-like [Ipomoea nil]
MLRLMGLPSLTLNYCILCFLLVYAAASGVENENQKVVVCPFRSIYQFGASLHDTGNLIRVGAIGPTLPAARLPYGITFPGRPTGRWSDGLLIVDFIARAVGLPLLNPYLDKNASFTNGVNFAVTASTALDIGFLAQKGVVVPSITVPLSGQINWLKTYLSSSICAAPSDCKDRLKRSLFFVGEIGRNDITFALVQGRTIQEVAAFVPDITTSVINAVREVIQVGGRRIVVPGTFPLGCFPNLLSQFGTQDPKDYDELGCLRSINNLTIFRNNHLQQALGSLRKEFPDAVILYADYYAAFQSFLARAPLLGFHQNKLYMTCCGSGGGQYNYDRNKVCGSTGVISCPNPPQYIHWDGVHLTQKAHLAISQIVIPNILSRIQCF